MKNEILENLHSINEKTSRNKSKNLDQVLLDFESELKYISEAFNITTVEALFLGSIIITNSEQKMCDVDDISMQLDLSKFIIFQNLSGLYSLQDKELIEIFEIEKELRPKNSFASMDYPFDILNKKFRLTENSKNKIINNH